MLNPYLQLTSSSKLGHIGIWSSVCPDEPNLPRAQHLQPKRLNPNLRQKAQGLQACGKPELKGTLQKTRSLHVKVVPQLNSKLLSFSPKPACLAA